MKTTRKSLDIRFTDYRHSHYYETTYEGCYQTVNQPTTYEGMLLNCKSADHESVEPVELVEAAEPVEPYIFNKRIAVK